MKGNVRLRRTSIDLLDEAADCCENISTIAELLKAAGQGSSSEPIDAVVIANTGHLIGNEIARLAVLLRSIHGATIRPQNR
jgi:hypothetical protein